jgi:hypothetical protein
MQPLTELVTWTWKDVRPLICCRGMSQSEQTDPRQLKMLLTPPHNKLILATVTSFLHVQSAQLLSRPLESWLSAGPVLSQTAENVTVG